jgi:serine/threonine protein kinase
VPVDLLWLESCFPQLSELHPLKEGGQKWVYMCQHPEHGACALKLMKPGRERYLDRELEAISRLSSDNVPEVYEIGEIDSPVGQCVWILEQYVHGTDLAEILQQGPLLHEQLLTLAVDLVATAADAESVKVVHRDIKPANIKIDGAGKAWLLDFGIARILDLKSKTSTAASFGPHTAGYGAPEQFRYRKREIGGRSDLFAIGVVLYECATGNNPFLEGTRDNEETLRRVEQQLLPRLRLEWDVNGEFADFVSALTQKYPYQRPPDCMDALAWLRGIVQRLGGT